VSAPKVLPVVTSILIILAVAVLRERSRTLSAILGTMPINMVLALWIVVGAPDATPSMTAGFVRSLLIGMVPTLIWLVVVYVAVRGGWALWPAVATGYAVWGGLIAATFWTGIFSIK
jgi:uncharacterized membrane protein